MNIEKRITNFPIEKYHISGIDGVFVIFSDVLSGISQYIFSYPFIKYYFSQQISLSTGNLYDLYVFKYIWLQFKNEGILSLYNGFFSYFAFYETLSFLEPHLNLIIAHITDNKIFQILLSNFILSFGFFIIAPFYSSVLFEVINNVSIYSAFSSPFITHFFSRFNGHSNNSMIQNIFVKSKPLSIFQIGFGLFSHYFSHKFIKFSFDSIYSFYNYMFCGKKKDCGVQGIFNNQRVNYIINSLAYVLCLPLLKALVRVCAQGFDICVDVISWSPTAIISCVSSPTFYMGFSDCMLSIYLDEGFCSYFYGIFPFFVALSIKYSVIVLQQYLTHKYLEYRNKNF